MHKYGVILVLFLTIGISARSNGLKPFRDGDTVCFIGNSITHGGKYHSLIYLFYLTRFPDETIRFYNCGISGDQASGAIRRMRDDILSKKPNKATFMFGMNDVGYTYGQEETEELLRKREESFLRYDKNLDTLIQQLHKNNIEIIFLTPTIYDETAKMDNPPQTGRNEGLRRCKNMVEEKAAKNNSGVVDFYSILDSLNMLFQENDPTFTIVGKDRVHPGIDGHFVMAYQFLKAQHVPDYVSEITIDASRISSDTCKNCEINRIMKTETGFAFTCLEHSLPFPLPDNLKADEWVPFREMNKEILKIEGLSEGDYKLTIDYIAIDTFSNHQFQVGINLALYDVTPQYQQAKKLADLNEWRRTLEANRLRSLALYDYGALWGNNEKSLDEKALLLKEKLEPAREKSYYGYLRTQADNYLLFKSLEAESNMVIDLITSILQTLNKPIQHKFLIEKIN